MANIVAPDPYIPCSSMYNCRIYDEDPVNFTKIYCSCGRFVDIERRTLLVKQLLHKTVECSFCRNARISEELNMLDENYCIIETPVVH